MNNSTSVNFSIRYSNTDLLSKEIDTIYEKDLENIIIKYHLMIYYDYSSSLHPNVLLHDLFLNKRFLEVFSNCLNRLDLDNNEIIFYNKIAYDYYEENKDDVFNVLKIQEIFQLLLCITNNINRCTINALSSILGIEQAKSLAIASKSSFSERTQIERINEFIINLNIDLSVKDIVTIYRILIKDFNLLFIYTMVSRLNSIKTTNNENISLALISLINEFSKNSIQNMLFRFWHMYTDGYQFFNIPLSNLRFSFHTTKFDTGKLKKVVEDIELKNRSIRFP